MTLSGKVCGELVKLYYQNKMNAAKALHVFCQNHLQRRGPCTPQGLCDLIKKLKDMGCTCDKLRSEQPFVSEDVVTEVHLTVTSGHMHTTRGTARVLDIPKTMVLKLLRSIFHMFPYRYQCIQVLPLGDPLLHIDFTNEFLIQFDANNNWPLCII